MGALTILSGPSEDKDLVRTCLLAFQMADHFIKVRDMHP